MTGGNALFVAHVYLVTIGLQQRELLGLGKVVGDHFFAHVLRGDFWHPAKLLLGFAGVASVIADLIRNPCSWGHGLRVGARNDSLFATAWAVWGMATWVAASLRSSQ